MKLLAVILVISLSALAFADDREEEIDIFLGRYNVNHVIRSPIPRNYTCPKNLEIIRKQNGTIAIKSPKGNFWAPRLLSKDKDITFSQMTETESLRAISHSLEDGETTRISRLKRYDNNDLALLHVAVERMEVDLVNLTVNPNTGHLLVEQKQGLLKFVAGKIRDLEYLSEYVCYYKRDLN